MGLIQRLNLLLISLLIPGLSFAATNNCMRFPTGTPVSCVDTAFTAADAQAASGWTSGPTVYLTESSDNVGIGTFNAYGKLHVYQSTASNPAQVFGNGGGNNLKIYHSSVSVEAPSYSNNGGTGDRTATIAVTSSYTFNNGSDLPVGDPEVLVNGTTGVNDFYNPGDALAGGNLRFDFGAGASELITEVKWIQSGTQTHGVFQWQGSDNATDWTSIGATFNLGGATTQTITVMSAATVGYRYYQLLGVSGTWNNGPYLYEIEFKIGDPGGSLSQFQQYTSGTTEGGVIALQPDGGNVGIGNTDAVNTLDVTGTASISGNTGIGTTSPTASLHVFNSAAQNSFKVEDAISDTTPFIIDAAGNVGIGSLTPYARLDIVAGAGSGVTANAVANNIVMSDDGSGGISILTPDTGLSYFVFGNTSDNLAAAIKWDYTSKIWTVGTQTTSGEFALESGSGSERIRIASGGNIGIGTVVPVALLNITSTANQNLFRVDDNGPGDVSPFVVDAAGNVGVGTTNTVYKVNLGSGDLNLTSGSGAVSFINTAGNGVELRANNTEVTFNGIGGVSNIATIERGGNIGIGTLNPLAFLDISYTTAQDLFMVRDNGTGDTTPFLINLNGNVGIGTVAPNYKLKVIAATEGGSIIIEDSDSDEATKNGRVGLESYDTGEEPFYVFLGRVDGNDNFANVGGGTSLGNAATKIQFYTAANDTTTTGTVAAVIDGAGNVGIGSIAPNAFLNIASTTAQILFRVDDNGGGDTTPFLIDAAGNVGIGTATSIPTALYVTSNAAGAVPVLQFRREGAGGGFAIGVDNIMSGSNADGLLMPVGDGSRDGGIVFYTTVGSTKTIAMGIRDNGNVGIGSLAPITAPAAGLHVIHSDSGDAFRVDDSDATDTTPFIISTNGNVGIGTVTPGTLLDINGGRARMVGIGTTVPQAVCIKADGTLGYYTSSTFEGTCL